MYYGSGTVKRNVSGQLADAAAYAPGRRCDGPKDVGIRIAHGTCTVFVRHFRATFKRLGAKTSHSNV